MAVTGASRARALAHWAIPIVVIGALFSPMVLTDRSFWVDSSNHLWLIGQRQHDFGGWPSYFVSSDRTGLFYPVFAFYGGPVYTAFAGLAVLLGHRPLIADRISWLVPFVMAYGGLTWLSFQVGLRGWRAQVPGLVFVSSAYYLTNIYGRGDWSETIATSAVPLLVASGLWLLRSPRWRWLPMLAFAIAAIFLSGSHNITLLWGTIFLTVVGIAVAWAFWPDVLRTIPPKRVGRLVLLGLVSVGVNLAFLLPTIVWARDTYTGASKQPFVFHIGTWFDSVFRALFDAVRYTPKGSLTPSLYLQLPVFLLLWVGAFLGLVVLSRRVVSRQIRRLSLGLSVIGLGLLFLMLWEEPWRYMPRILRFIQFNLRLISFEVLILAGLTMVGLKVLESHPIRHRTAWQGALVLVLTYGFALGVWQVWTSESYLPRRSDGLTPAGVAPASWVDQSYRDVSAPVVKVPAKREAFLDPSREQNGRFDELVGLPEGSAPIAINITAGPRLIDVRGVDVIGRTPERSPRMVIRRRPGHLNGAVRIRIETAAAAPITVGRWLSVVSLSILVVWIVATGVTGTVAFRRARRRRRGVRLRRDQSHREADSAGYAL
jgi:hypothetical protein